MLNLNIYPHPSDQTVHACHEGTAIVIDQEDAEYFASDVNGWDEDANSVGKTYEATISENHWNFWLTADEAKR